MPEGKDKTQRRVYVLPTELVDRIVAYQHQVGLSSEVEAARRLLDDALKQRDTFLTITTKFIEKRNETKSFRDAARDTLADHPLVTNIQFHEDGIRFALKNGMSVLIDSWGSATVYDQSGDVYDFDANFEDIPRWASHNHPRPKKKADPQATAAGTKSGYDLDDDIPF